jgi:hypothetical protein
MGSQGKPPELSLSTPLFAADRVVERTLQNGITIRARLEPLGAERVRILEYYRRDRTGKWQRRPEEEGRTPSFSTLGLSSSYASVFGISADKPEEL